jgi:hypothetical protein
MVARLVRYGPVRQKKNFSTHTISFVTRSLVTKLPQRVPQGMLPQRVPQGKLPQRPQGKLPQRVPQGMLPQRLLLL